MERVLGNKSLLNKFTYDAINSANIDKIELDNNGKNIILRGSNTICLATAFNWYLQDICNK